MGSSGPSMESMMPGNSKGTALFGSSLTHWGMISGTHKVLLAPSIHPFLLPTIGLSIHLSLYSHQSIYHQSIYHPPIHPSIHPSSVSLSIHSSIYPPISPFLLLYSPTHPPTHLSLPPSISIHPSTLSLYNIYQTQPICLEQPRI
jgi:hypothetical protein